MFWIPWMILRGYFGLMCGERGLYSIQKIGFDGREFFVRFRKIQHHLHITYKISLHGGAQRGQIIQCWSTS